MWKSPGFTTVAIATLALGIGANTAIFSVVNAALLSPLPFPEPDRLVAVWTTVQRESVERRGSSYPDYVDLRDRSRSFDSFAAWASATLTLASTGDAAAQQVRGELVSAPYFAMLGATPIMGRTFTDAEDAERNAHPVAV